MTSVEISSLEKSFGDTQVLSEIKLRIESGEFISLLGASGSGKSTLLRILAGLEHQDAGTIKFNGQCVDSLSAKDRGIAMVFQSYALYPHMNVFENMALPLEMMRLSWNERLPFIKRASPSAREKNQRIKSDVIETARVLGLENLLSRKPGELSGGQRQRVAIGRAIVRDPTLFLMDEPLSNLDAALRTQMRKELKALHNRLRKTIVFVTHDQSEAMTLSNRIAVMSGGRIVQFAPPHEIYSKPKNVFVAKFIGRPEINLVQGTHLGDGRVSTIVGEFQLSSASNLGEVATIGIRPESFSIDRKERLGSTLRGELTDIENHGSELFLEIRVEDQTIRARSSMADIEDIGVGAIVSFGMNVSSHLCFNDDGDLVCGSVIYNQNAPHTEASCKPIKALHDQGNEAVVKS